MECATPDTHFQPILSLYFVKSPSPRMAQFCTVDAAIAPIAYSGRQKTAAEAPGEKTQSERAEEEEDRGMISAGESTPRRAEAEKDMAVEKQQPATTAVRAWLDTTSTMVTRALFPKVMEFKVICREREKHEFMPVVYVIDRSESWKKRVPAYIERELIQAYITPVVLGDCTQPRSRNEVDEIARATVSTKLTQLAQELLQRTRLMDTAVSGVCIDESKYKLGVLVDYSVSGGAREKADLYQVVRVIASTLRDATHKRALIVPVSMHYCSTGSFVNVKRYVGIRYGAPVLLEERDTETFRVDPTEFVQHISARLSASLKMQPPSTAAQMEILRLSRTLHVYCAKVFRDDCFSRRQIASMNEEILQIHFRTRNHPDMHVLKGKMQKYCRILKKWRLRDEDINSAAIETHQPPKSPLYLMWLLASLLQRVITAPAQLFVSGACDLIYRPPHTKAMVMTAAIASAVVKCTLALISIGVLVRIAQSRAAFWAFVFVLSFLLLLHVTKESLGYREVAQHLKKIQFYLMDASELQELKKTRAVLARRIHALVAQYVITDLPPPVLQDRSKASADDTVLPNNDEYTLNPHHKIFINAPRSFPLAYMNAIKDPLVVRRVIHAPKMLRDETWRTIYETLAPKHLRFSALLVDNKGDNLPMDALLQTPFFNAVLTAYVKYQNQQVSDDEHDRAGDCGTSPVNAHETTAEDCEQQTANCFGSFGSSQEVIDAALQLAQEEDELSS